MRINLTELFSVDGKEKSYKVNIEMDSFQAFGDTCKVISKEPVTLHIQNVGGGKLLMEGKTFITLWAGKENQDAFYVAIILMSAYIFILTEDVGTLILWAMNQHREQAILKIVILTNIFTIIISFI